MESSPGCSRRDCLADRRGEGKLCERKVRLWCLSDARVPRVDLSIRWVREGVFKFGFELRK